MEHPIASHVRSSPIPDGHANRAVKAVKAGKRVRGKRKRCKMRKQLGELPSDAQRRIVMLGSRNLMTKSATA